MAACVSRQRARQGIRNVRFYSSDDGFVEPLCVDGRCESGKVHGEIGRHDRSGMWSCMHVHGVSWYATAI